MQNDKVYHKVNSLCPRHYTGPNDISREICRHNHYMVLLLAAKVAVVAVAVVVVAVVAVAVVFSFCSEKT